MKEILKTSIYSSIGAMLIMALLQPFGLDQLEGDVRIKFLLGETFVILVCCFVWQFFYSKIAHVGISSWMLGKHKNATTVLRISLILLPSFVGNAFFISAALMMFCGWFYTGNAFAYIFMGGTFNYSGYWEMLVQVLMISLFVYIWAIYSSYNNYLEDEVSELRTLNRMLEERQEVVAAIEAESSSEAEEASQTCLIQGNYQNDLLEVDPRNIFYVESMSNYADICFMQEGQTCHQTMRITLKQLRESLAQIDCLVSCHRAFIVNINFVVSISSRESGGYQLQLFGIDKQIPVSRSYTEEIKNKLAMKKL